jgi:CheY-like chemotaxis protein/HPt (histidine-containing phosphotransfer) domain-containing protein
MSSVRDTGIGIPDEKLNSLFKPFSQLDASHSSKYGGTGLGLMICKEFATMMGGKIGVDSELNVGSNFHFTIKLTSKTSKVVVHENHVSKHGFDLKNYETEDTTPYDNNLIEKRKNYNILVAEDNVVNQKILVRMLAELGFTVEAVNNGKEAVEKIQSGDFKAILMDVQMPEMDGFEATKLIRNLDDPLNKIPVIAITAHALKGDRENCLQAGMNDYVTKPVQVKQLAKVLDSWINIKVSLKEKKTSEIKPDDGIFDIQRFTEMSLGDINFQRELLMDYFEDLDQRLTKLDEFLDKKDLDKVIKEVHTIKGSSFSIGAKRIGEEALGIELSGKTKDWDSVFQRFQTLKTAFGQTKEVVKHLL